MHTSTTNILASTTITLDKHKAVYHEVQYKLTANMQMHRYTLGTLG